MNQILYGPNINVCPRDIGGGDLVIPLELEANIEAGNMKKLAESLVKIKQYHDCILTAILRYKLSNAEIWKKTDKSGHSVPLKVGDIVFIKLSVGGTGSSRLGVILELTTTTAMVQSISPTGQKSQSKYNLCDLILAVSC